MLDVYRARDDTTRKRMCIVRISELTPNGHCDFQAFPLGTAPMVNSIKLEEAMGTTWAQNGHKSKTPTVSGRLLTGKAPYLLVARVGFEPTTFGL